MKIALVLCPSWGIETPHLGQASLAANLRKNGFEVEICDLNLKVHTAYKEKGLWKSEEDIHWEDKEFLRGFIRDNDNVFSEFVKEILSAEAEVTGFTVYNTNFDVSLEIARRLKKEAPDRFIICGGVQCSSLPPARYIIENVPEVDAVVRGEGDEVIVNIMKDIEKKGKITPLPGILLKDNGKVADSGFAPPVSDLDSLPYPDFSGFKLGLYGNPSQLPILSSRGCPYSCVYCNTRIFWSKCRSMSGERIFDEITYQLNSHKDVYFFTFNDHTVNADMGKLSRFLDLVIDMKNKKGLQKENFRSFQWRACAVIRKEMDKDFIKRLKLSGCIELELGIESGSGRIRRLMRKPPADIKTIEEVIRNLTQEGIGVRANFMFGFPGETEEDFQATMKFLHKNKDYFAQVHPSETFCHIDPGTYIYNHPEEFGVRNYKNNPLYWESDDGRNNYPERLRRHQEFCSQAVALKIPLSPGGHKILLHRQHFIDEYNYYIVQNRETL